MLYVYYHKVAYCYLLGFLKCYKYASNYRKFTVSKIDYSSYNSLIQRFLVYKKTIKETIIMNIAKLLLLCLILNCSSINLQAVSSWDIYSKSTATGFSDRPDRSPQIPMFPTPPSNHTKMTTTANIAVGASFGAVVLLSCYIAICYCYEIPKRIKRGFKNCCQTNRTEVVNTTYSVYPVDINQEMDRVQNYFPGSNPIPLNITQLQNNEECNQRFSL